MILFAMHMMTNLFAGLVSGDCRTRVSPAFLVMHEISALLHQTRVRKTVAAATLRRDALLPVVVIVMHGSQLPGIHSRHVMDWGCKI